jgi:hypothetical protein
MYNILQPDVKINVDICITFQSVFYQYACINMFLYNADFIFW